MPKSYFDAYPRTGKLVEVPDLDYGVHVYSPIAQNEAYQSNHRPSAIPGQRARPENPPPELRGACTVRHHHLAAFNTTPSAST
jgi:hypothetical protein